MSFTEYLNSLLSRAGQKYPKATFRCLVAAMICCGVGSYKLAGYLSSISPGIKTFFLVLGVPVLIAVVLLILYILWKIYKGISWLMDQPSYGHYEGRLWVPDRFGQFLHAIANNKIVINIETAKSTSDKKTDGGEEPKPNTVTSPATGKDA